MGFLVEFKSNDRRCGLSYRGRKKYRQLVQTRPLLSVFKPKISEVHLSDRFPFPLEFRNHVVSENHSGVATRPKKFDDIFSRLDTIPACDDGQQDRQLSTAKTALAERRAGKITRHKRK